MKNVNKNIFLNSLAFCTTLGWLIRNDKIELEATKTISDDFRMEQGRDIGERARSNFPDGFLVTDWNVANAVKETMDLMKNPDVKTIFEATFLVDRFVAKVDILKRTGKAWQIVEVKSSVNDKPELIDDMAYTYMVVSKCNVPVSGISLMLVSRDYRLGMGNDKLFTEIDHTNDVQEKAALFETVRQQIEMETSSENKPTPTLRFKCKDCVIFDKCVGLGVNNHVFEIPRLSESKFTNLTGEGFVSINDISDGFDLTPNQSIVRSCVKTGKEFIAKDLKEKLSSIKFPAYYLDFETVQTTIPLYADIAPYTQLPTQYSIHKCSATGKVTDHLEYLSDPTRDCRRELAEHLIKDLSGNGSIIVYSSFEKVRINNLAAMYQDIAKELESLVPRLVDLNAIIAKCFYHPEFHGSTSIKVTLPVLVPNLLYDDLVIRDGDTAVTTFAYMALGRLTGDEAELAKKNLLKYCERDTLAMVAVHEQLAKYT